MASNKKKTGRRRRQERVRKKVWGTDARPRVGVFRSNKHIYAQVISDDRGATLAAASTLSAKSAAQDESKKNHGVEAAKRGGLTLAKLCKEQKNTRVVFDRNGFLYYAHFN